MFNDIENTLLDNDLQACLIGDFNAHTGNMSEYVVIDNNILDVLNTMTRISKRVINMNIFTKEISHKNTDSTRPCFTILTIYRW
jgi:hypothetical protein